MFMHKIVLFILLFGFISALPAQSPLLDLHLCKLQTGVFTKKEFNLINGDTIYKKFEKYLTAVEGVDSVLYVESFNVNRSWTLARYIVRGKERAPAGWQSEYDINGYKLIARYCEVETGDCNLIEKFSYYPNGNRMAAVSYYKHKLNGNSYFYHNDGSLKNSIEYNNGKLWNINAYYDQNGNSLDQGTICDGTGMVYVYASTGKLINMRWYKAGKKLK